MCHKNTLIVGSSWKGNFIPMIFYTCSTNFVFKPECCTFNGAPVNDLIGRHVQSGFICNMVLIRKKEQSCTTNTMAKNTLRCIELYTWFSSHAWPYLQPDFNVLRKSEILLRQNESTFSMNDGRWFTHIVLFLHMWNFVPQNYMCRPLKPQVLV